MNHEKGKLDFYKFNPDKVKEIAKEIAPTNEYKTQVAVNSEGKNNEATKNLGEPLKIAQNQPTEKLVEKQEKVKENKQAEAPKKSKNRRM